jgi:WD40 repeat protein
VNSRLTIALSAVLLSGCVIRSVAPPPMSPEVRRAMELARQSEALRDDPAQEKKMMEELMGRAPLSEQVSTDGIQVVFQTGHVSMINAVAISRDGRYILSAGRDETVKLWDVASGHEIRTLAGVTVFGGLGTSVRFTDDARRIIVGGVGIDGDFYGARIFAAASGEPVEAASGVLSDDGRYVARQNTPQARILNRQVEATVSVLDTRSGQVIWTAPPAGIAQPVALSEEGHILLLGEEQTTFAPARQRRWSLQAWDVSSRRLLRRIDNQSAPMSGLVHAVISPDGHTLAAENEDHTLNLYDLSNDTGPRTLGTPSASPTVEITNSIVFSGDSRLIASSRANLSSAQVSVWEVSSGRLITQFPGSAVNFSADGTTLVVGGSAGGAPALRDLATGKQTALSAGASAVVDVAPLAGRQTVAAAMEDGTIRFWNVTTAELVRTLECPGHSAATSVSADTTARWLATGCRDGSAWLWDLAAPSGGPRQITAATQQLATTLVRFSPDGHWIAVGVKDQLVIWSVLEGREINRANLPESQLPPLMGAAADIDTRSIQALAIGPDSRRIAVGRLYDTSLWDPATGKRISLLGETGESLPALTASAANPQALLEALRGGASVSKKDARRAAKGSGFTALPPSPMDMMNAMGMNNGARALAFSPDGRTLVALSTVGKQAWDLDTGRRIRPPAAEPGAQNDLQASLRSNLEVSAGESGAVAMSPDGRFGARAVGRVIKIWDTATGRDLHQLVGHTSNIAALTYLDGGRMLASGGRDGTLRLWRMPQGAELAQLIALGDSDYVAVTPDQFYRASRAGIREVAFRIQNEVYPFEQFDLRFNRPDILLERLGGASQDLISTYRAAYGRRLSRMGLSENKLGLDLHLPQVAFIVPAPVRTDSSSLTLRVRSTDDKSALDRINVFVNDVPVFGTAGLPLSGSDLHQDERSIEVPLIPGRNKIQVSALNKQGAESLKQTAYTTSTADRGAPDVYIVAIGVSEYQNHAYNLRFAAKDASDLVETYRATNSGSRGQVHVLDLTNQKATRGHIQEAKAWLQQARPNDLVVVFAAGHGMTDTRQNYFFGTYDIDPVRPELNGLPYEEFEALLDGIASLQKVLLIDTCFSGEIEKDEPTVVSQAQTDGAGNVKMRAFKAPRGIEVVADPAGSDAMLRFQQDLFADLRRGTGAVVISSASGNEYALEGEQWKNGVFTYALLSGLRDHKADANKDGTITVGELQAYVIDEVRRLTAGGQHPTARRENLDYDFAVY